MKMLKTMLALPVFCLLSAALYAHTELRVSSPAEGVVLQQAPAALTLEFSEEVQLLKLVLASADGVAQQTGFTASAQSAASFSIPLSTLASAQYAASWTILGKDGHRVEGTLHFTIDPSASESAGTAASAAHHGH